MCEAKTPHTVPHPCASFADGLVIAQKRDQKAWAGTVLLTAYRRVLSPMLHATGLGGCKYRPTCSEYAEVAFARYGTWKGGWLTLKRLARCTPFGRGGFDPVP